MKLSQITHITIIAVFAVVMSGVANADNTCYSGGANGISVDTSTNGTTHTYNRTDMTWTAIFAYGDLSGIAVCNGTSGTWGVATQTNFESGTTGVNCWCKMLSPANSLWVYRYASTSTSICASDCAVDCGYAIYTNASYRGGLFGSLNN